MFFVAITSCGSKERIERRIANNQARYLSQLVRNIPDSLRTEFITVLRQLNTSTDTTTQDFHSKKRRFEELETIAESDCYPCLITKSNIEADKVRLSELK